MSDWKALAQSKADAINELIPQKWLLPAPLPSVDEQRDVTDYIRRFLSAREIEITETDAVGIVARTTTGAWTAREVAEAFCHRAALAHQMVSCLHEIFFDAAFADAEKLDEYFTKHQKPVGPLHGLPVSLKDQFHVRDVETTMGYVGWIGTFEGKKRTGKEKTFESEMVRELRALGAVLYVKTSVPHTLMSGETINNIIGYTTNPKNRHLTAGGSSGGEGALIGLKGSAVGFGTDIAGSIRMPAAFNGLYGLKPSTGRLPYEGMATSMDGQNTVLSAVGPLATSAGGLRLVTKSLLSQQPWLHDPLVVEIPWRDEIKKEVFKLAKGRGLTFGILAHDGVVTPHPPVKRALDIVKVQIEGLGYKVIEWQPPAHARATEILFKAMLYDGGADVHDNFELSGEKISTQIAGLYGETRSKPQYNASQIATTNVEKREYQKEYLDFWNSTSGITGTGRPIDAWLAPVAPFAAARPGRYDYYGYSTITNLLDYTTAVIPVTLADKTVDLRDETYRPLSEEDRKVWESYDAEIYDGAHVAVQLVGRRYQEEKVLALAEIIGEALGK
ncbi:amidase signature domain-containing protein [Xylogone sp. PMI_703]|nr:amidase signature domain-containing protein [Xylogone sp. PMI_703]